MQHSPGFLKLVQATRANIVECGIEDLKKVVDARKSGTLVIDTREDHEWAQGHIPGAIHLSKGIIERDIEKTVPNLQTPLYLYCGGGFRSALVAENLKKMGYTHCISVDGGFRAWKENGYPIET